jgi:hypothetical protein
LTTELPTRTAFEECIGTVFRLAAGAGAGAVIELELELVEVKVHRPSANPRADPSGRPFSLLFRGRADLVLPQRIYSLEHRQLGTLEIFLVPVGRDSSGVQYEAVFN